MEIKQLWKEKGYACEPIPEDIDLRSEIRRMCAEKNAVIMAHYYTDASLQEIADFIGDSLALARKAAQTDAKIIVMCGVHFMGETNKVLCPDRKVLIPDLNASCSLAESCPAREFGEFVKAHPGHRVISYVNTSADVKALTDIVVTSSNARQIVESFPKDEPIIFGPDRNLGEYLNQVTGREMVLWNGACHVHERFSVGKILGLKQQYPDAKVLAHPECKGPVLKLADVVGSLPGYFAKEECEVRVILPKYLCMEKKFLENMHFLCHFYVDLNWRRQYVGVFEATYRGITYYLIDNEYYFAGDQPYNHLHEDVEKFAYFSKAVLQALPYLDYAPEIIHCHDWQTGLVPVFLKTCFGSDPYYAGIKTVFTIHNMKFQGRWNLGAVMDITGLPEQIFNSQELESYGEAN